jgi:hypothetical protein
MPSRAVPQRVGRARPASRLGASCATIVLALVALTAADTQSASSRSEAPAVDASPRAGDAPSHDDAGRGDAERDGPGGDDTGEKVRPALRDTLEEEGEAAFWVRFTDRADLAHPSSVHDWASRGDAVVGALQDTADASQAEVRRQLDDADVEHHAFWVTNAILVHDGKLDGALEVAERHEVEPTAASRPRPPRRRRAGRRCRG